MKSKNIINFCKVIKWSKDLRSRYMFTLATHRTFMELDRVRTETYAGKKTAHKNVKILKKYNYYFATTKEGLRYYLIIELAKFFEISSRKKSLTIEHLLNYSEKNLNKLSKEYFKEYHKDQEFLTKDLGSLKEISINDIQSFRKRIENNKEKIQNIKYYRDEYIAHDDIKKKKYTIKNRDISTLLRLVKDIVNFYYLKLEWTSNCYDNFDKEPIRDTKRIFKDLRNYDIFEEKAWKK